MRKLYWTVVAVTLVALMPGCGGKVTPPVADDKAAAPKEEPKVVIPIQAERPERGDVSAYLETTSRIEAETRVEVVSKGIGRCLSVHAEEGQKVSKGDVLAELDKEDAQIALRQAEVQLRQQKTTRDRARSMATDGIGAVAEYDNAQFAYEQTQENIRAMKARVDDLSIRAPITGIITRRVIQPGVMVVTGVPVFSIADPNTFILNISAPENEVSRLRVGQEAKVSLDALQGEEFTAKVRRINPAVEATSGTVKVVLDFDGPTQKRLRDAAFTRVRLIMETHKNTLLVPKDSIIEENARKYVMLVEPASNVADTASETVAGQDVGAATAAKTAETTPRLLAKRVEVRTGLEDGGRCEIISGIDDASLIVTLGQQTLKTGAEVRVTNAAKELATRATISSDEALSTAKAKRETEKAKASARTGVSGSIGGDATANAPASATTNTGDSSTTNAGDSAAGKAPARTATKAADKAPAGTPPPAKKKRAARSTTQ